MKQYEGIEYDGFKLFNAGGWMSYDMEDVCAQEGDTLTARCDEVVLRCSGLHYVKQFYSAFGYKSDTNSAVALVRDLTPEETRTYIDPDGDTYYDLSVTKSVYVASPVITFDHAFWTEVGYRLQDVGHFPQHGRDVAKRYADTVAHYSKMSNGSMEAYQAVTGMNSEYAVTTAVNPVFMALMNAVAHVFFHQIDLILFDRGKGRA